MIWKQLLGTAALTIAMTAPFSAVAQEQEAGHGEVRAGPVDSDQFHTSYIRLPHQSEGLLYEPAARAHPRVAILFTHPGRNNFDNIVGRQMARRGYRALMVNYRGRAEFGEAEPETYLPGISAAIHYLRSLPDVERVILIGHSGGGHLVSLYGAVTEKGPTFCSGPEKIYPCRTRDLEGLEKIDGIVFLDATLGAFHQMSAIDPAISTGPGRDERLDMLAPGAGYDAATRRASYLPDFILRFYAAQAARNGEIVDRALFRLRLIEAGQGDFSDDEPLVVRGMGVRASGARLYQTDTRLAAHTKRPHLLLRADGTTVRTLVPSVRQPSAKDQGEKMRSLAHMAQDTTVRRFLATSAIRTGPDYAITADDIIGVQWSSAYNSTPAMAEGISVPALVLTMSCHYLLVPGEIIFDHLASRDKSYTAVEGADHEFAPCRPTYGDTRNRTFDYLDYWLSQRRF